MESGVIVENLEAKTLATIEKQIRSKERWIFLKRWIKKPKQVGTLAPISPSLSRMAANFIAPHHRVVELGAGTGRLTRLLCQILKPENLIVLELEKEYCDFLKQTIPQVVQGPILPQIIEGDAANLLNLLPPSWQESVDVVLSVLPLMYMPLDVRDTLINQALTCLRPLGTLLHVTYSPWSPLRHREDIDQECLGRCYKNVPPGYVWRFSAAIPGRVRPSIHSMNAPPAVEI